MHTAQSYWYRANQCGDAQAVGAVAAMAAAFMGVTLLGLRRFDPRQLAPRPRRAAPGGDIAR